MVGVQVPARHVIKEGVEIQFQGSVRLVPPHGIGFVDIEEEGGE